MARTSRQHGATIPAATMAASAALPYGKEGVRKAVMNSRDEGEPGPDSQELAF